MISESFKYGWAKFKENMEISLFTTLLMLAVGAFSGKDRHDFSLLAMLAILFLIIIRIGYNKIFLRIYDGEKPVFTDIFKEYPLFWKFLGNSILYPLAVAGGLILLIVPGIIWAVRFSFSPLIVIDTKAGPIKAMKESYAITKGVFWKILLFWIAVALFNIAGAIALGVGLLITVPVSTFAAVYVYRKLTMAAASLTP